MKQEVLSFFNLPSLTVIGLVLFFTLFSGMLWWVLQKTREPLYDHLANLPLQEDA